MQRSIFHAASPDHSSHRALTLAAAIALALAGSSAPRIAHTATSAQVLVVQNCNDSGAGSLRETYAAASDGAVVDLSQLACSTITLTSGPVSSGIYPGSVAISGSAEHRVTISGNNSGRVIVHSGEALQVSNLTIEAGVAHDFAGGGCIFSQGDVRLSNATVHDCEVSTTGSVAAVGGAILANGRAYLLGSTVSSSSAHAAASTADGGGIHASYVFTDWQSSVTGNSASSGDDHLARGGGAYAAGGLRVRHTTFSGNSAGSGGALYVGAKPGFAQREILNSTISGNSASGAGGGVRSAFSITVYNSTITANQAGFDFGAGMYLGQGAVLSSTIVAGNSSSGGLTASDIGGNSQGTVFGENNLIIASTLMVPKDTLMIDPKLGPLADNGGGMLTHALLPGSPAIDAGANFASLPGDQRLYVCNPKCQLAERSVGDAPDIGAIESGAPDHIFDGRFEVET